MFKISIIVILFLMYHLQQLIKSYAMSVAYDEAKSIKFYDKKGTLIPEEHIPDL